MFGIDSFVGYDRLMVVVVVIVPSIMWVSVHNHPLSFLPLRRQNDDGDDPSVDPMRQID